MTNIWKAKSTNYFVITTQRDLPNITDWNINFVNLSTGVIQNVTTDVGISEVTRVITTPAEGIIQNETQAGSKTISLGSGDGVKFSKGTKIFYTSTAGIEYNTIKSLSGDTITLWSPTKGIINALEKITESGKTGDYRVTVDLSKPSFNTFTAGARFQVQVNSVSTNIDVTSQIFNISDYSVVDDLGTDMNYIKSSLDTIISDGGASASIFI